MDYKILYKGDHWFWRWFPINKNNIMASYPYILVPKCGTILTQSELRHEVEHLNQQRRFRGIFLFFMLYIFPVQFILLSLLSLFGGWWLLALFFLPLSVICPRPLGIKFETEAYIAGKEPVSIDGIIDCLKDITYLGMTTMVPRKLLGNYIERKFRDVEKN